MESLKNSMISKPLEIIVNLLSSNNIHQNPNSLVLNTLYLNWLYSQSLNSVNPIFIKTTRPSIFQANQNSSAEPAIPSGSLTSLIQETPSKVNHLLRSEKPFKCTYYGCIKEYRSKENLNLHYQNKHLSQKPYKCCYCSSVFSHRNGKIYHERIKHTLIFPYKCTINSCNFKTASKSALIYHEKNQHQESK